VMGAYGYDAGSNFTYFLKNQGDGSYVDKTVDWGLPRKGTFLPLTSAQLTSPRMLEIDRHLHETIGGPGGMSLFIGGGGTDVAEHYKWNGSTYVKQPGALTNLL